MSGIVSVALPSLDLTAAWSLAGEPVESVEPIGEGTRSRVYRITLVEGGSRVVRLTPKRFQRVIRERHARETLGAAVPTVAEVVCEHPTLSKEVDVVMMRELPGRTLAATLDRADAGESVALWKAFGEGLAAIHNVSVEGFGLLEGPGRAGALDWPSVAGELGEHALEKARVTELADLCDAAASRLATLAPSLHQVRAARLIHGDAQPANVQVYQGRVVAWLDLEYAMGADPLYELAFVERFIERAAAPHREAFARGYGSDAPHDPERLAHYRIVHALRAWEFLQVAAPTLDVPARDRAVSAARARLEDAINRS